MLTQEQNERLTQTGPRTPMGELLRRYWHPVAPSAELNEENPTKRVRLLSEDLVLFRSASGNLGLVEPHCAHRKANLFYGIPEPEGIRCMYHGWLYDETGACLDQPSEPEGSRFKEKIRLKAYPVQELRGLIFAYLGPEPAPMLPRWDLFVWDNVKRSITRTMIPCNWLQCQDNSLDPVHFEWLHRYWGSYMASRYKSAEERAAWDRTTAKRGAHHVKVGFDRFEYGIIKRRMLIDETEDDEFWRLGHPVLFPNILRVGSGRQHRFQIRVPVDDTHTLHFHYTVDLPEQGQIVEQDVVPYRDVALVDEQQEIIRTRGTDVSGQDQSAWVAQGPICDRTTEHLGVSDIGIIAYRKLIEDQLKIMGDGGDPINVHRTKKDIIVLPQEHSYYPGYSELGGPFRNKPLVKPDVEATLSKQSNLELLDQPKR